MKRIISFITSAALTVSLVVSSGIQAAASYLYSESSEYYYYNCIIKLMEEPISKNEKAREMGVSEFILTPEGNEEYNALMDEHKFVQEQLSSFLGSDISVQYEYTAAFNGFSLALRYDDYKKVRDSKEALGISEINVISLADIRSEAYETDNSSTSGTSADTYDDLTSMINETVGADSVPYSGDGTVIAVIDSVFDLEHEFLTMPDGAEGRLSQADIQAISPYTSAASNGGSEFYYSEKIPFAFNYDTIGDDFDRDGFDHGTHVAGIAAGNSSAVTGSEYNPQGIAENAQLALMSVWGLEDDKLLAAYDDCLYIGADVINASYGASGGTIFGDKEHSEAIENIIDTGVVFCTAAGNDGKADTGVIDYSTGGTPNNITSALSVGSAENYINIDKCIDVNGNSYIISPGTHYILTEFDGQTFEYVSVPGLGEASDYDNIDVNGKIALVARGEITFDEKAANALEAGAVGIIFYNTAGSQRISVACDTLPSGLVSYDDGMKMIDAAEKTVSFNDDDRLVLIYDKEVMSEFSSWDFTETLMLKPDITGFGGYILSSVPNDIDAASDSVHNKYDIMSGTSMSTPQLAGLNALLKQYLKENRERYGITSQADYTELMAKLLMSTATPIYTSDGFEIASPRVQGNGLANIADAINTPCYISSESAVDNYRPKISLGEDNTGNYNFVFNIHNVSDTAQTYNLNNAVFCDSYENGELSWNTQRLVKDEDYTIKFTDLNYGMEIEEITVEPGDTAAVSANVTITGKYDEIFEENENGAFIDGYITLYGESVPELTLSFMVFCGDWSENNRASLIEEFVYKNSELEYSSFLSDGINIAGTNIIRAIEAYMDEETESLDINQFISKPYFSPIDETNPNMEDYSFNNLFADLIIKRRCYDVTAEIYNKNNELVYTQVLGSGYVFTDEYGALQSHSYEIEWDFRDLDGEIHNNETYTIWFTAKTPLSDSYSLTPVTQSFTVDTENPVVESCYIININNTKYMVMNVSDNGAIQGAIAFSKNKELYDLAGVSENTKSKSLVFAVPDDYSDGYAEVYDMAGNCETIYFTDTGNNELTLNTSGPLYYTSDEKTFKDKFYFTDESGEMVDVDFDFSSVPQTVYDEGIDYVTLLIGDESIADVTVEVGIKGDANMSGSLDVRDASYIAVMMANRNTSEYAEFIESLAGYCGDYNKDGVTNIRDAAAIAAYLASRYDR